MIENVIIIGGGPAGLAGATYNARANLSPLLFAGSPPGGQLTLTSEVENYPGFESILGPELVEKMRNQSKKFGTRIHDENVLKVNFSKQPFQISTYNKSYHAKTILIATGAKALWLELESETRLRGKGVSACATCDGFFFKNKVVGVVGGGDTAMEETLTLTKFASKVYLIHRRNEFRASKIMQERVLNNPKVEVIYNTVVEEIIGEKKVEGIRLKNFQFPISNFQSISNNSITNENSNIENSMKIAKLQIKNLKLDGVFIAIGHKPDTDLFKGQIELDKKGYIITSDRAARENFQFTISNLQSNLNDLNIKNSNIENSLKIENLKLIIPKFDINYTSQTSVSGVFAAGDCVDHVYRQAATAVGMGVAAALEVEKYLEI